MTAKVVSVVVLMGSCAWAHDPITTKITYNREIVRLFQKRCATCHQDGGKAPMSLMSYESARPWAKAIKEEVLERRMPPWGAVKGFGEFGNDRGLTQEEVSLIADWVEGGAPEGDAKLLPEIHPAEPPEKVKLSGRRVRVDRMARLSAGGTAVGIQPVGEGDIGAARVWAERPDGSVEPLVWLRGYKGAWKNVFAFRKPVALPAGTEVRVDPPAAAFEIIMQRGGAAAR